MDTFLEHAQQILDVARGDAAGTAEDFALIVRPDGCLHFLMETPFSLAAAAADGGARSAYRVTRTPRGVRVEGWSAGRTCLLEDRAAGVELLKDQPLYRITSCDSKTTGPEV